MAGRKKPPLRLLRLASYELVTTVTSLLAPVTATKPIKKEADRLAAGTWALITLILILGFIVFIVTVSFFQ